MKEKLIPLIVQDYETKQVLSLFYCNKEAIARMKKTGYVWRFSRRYGKLMKKGESSGNFQKIVDLKYDCDKDALLARVEQMGDGACHTGKWSCFGKEKEKSWGVLEELIAVIEDRKKNPKKKSYVSSIINKPEEIGDKLIEEAGELEEAILQKQDKEVVWETADLLFFTLVGLENRGIDLQKVLEELKRRSKI
ncbi:MAG: bifunctional phosphoribosyl-AMP cyclohydrolase/phosphoribosyl-ATP diphosphatase HisIE [Candidatus Micrarchaeota archaeon]